MMLRTRVLATSLAMALPAAGLATLLVDRVRDRDLRTALERVVRSQVNDQTRERCESDPTWFLTGPLEGRPAGGAVVSEDPDAIPARPRVVAQPYELFAYDVEFIGSSSATPRIPTEYRAALRRGESVLIGPFETPEGTGAQMAIRTGWQRSICTYLLGRMAPPPRQRATLVTTFAFTFLAAFGLAMGGGAGIVLRVRRLAKSVRASATSGYPAIAPDRRTDELSAFTFAYNDAVNELRVRKARIDDQDAALYRLVQTTEEEVGVPMRKLTDTLGALAQSDPQNRAVLAGVLADSHALTSRVENLGATTRLRMSGGAGIVPARVSLNALARRVAARYLPIAHGAGVTLQVSVPETEITITGDETLLERALANLVDNAIRYNRPGGEVMLTLAPSASDNRFRLWVSDNGRGVTEEEFRGLTAVRRFRGDEGRNRRPGAPGLGLAIAREVTDRLGLQLDLKRPGTGGFEAEISGPARQTPDA
jgi:signal transduction histidine kinase